MNKKGFKKNIVLTTMLVLIVLISISAVSAYPGCMDELANNYDGLATEDDGSCTYGGAVLGCMDETALNYDGLATEDDGSCYYNPGCDEAPALNYDPLVDFNDGSCIYYCTETISPCGGGCPTTSLSGMFDSYDFGIDSAFVGSIVGWDTSCITDMNTMFQNSIGFNQDISGWNTSSVTSMAYMFKGTDEFNQPIGSWDVSGVTNMYSMFGSALAFNQSLNDWDTGSVTDMWGMFGGTHYNQNISAWNTSSVTDMSYMFAMNSLFNQDIGGWDTSNVTNMHGMFWEAHDFNQDIGGWDVSNVLTMDTMFSAAYDFNQDLSGWCVTNIASKPAQFDVSSAFSGQTALQPQWGTCPAGGIVLNNEPYDYLDVFVQVSFTNITGTINAGEIFSGDNWVYVDNTSVANVPATIIFNVGGSNFIPVKDGSWCTISDGCSNIVNTGTYLIFDVVGFSNYTYEEYNLSYCTEEFGPCGGGCPITDFSNMFNMNGLFGEYFMGFDWDIDSLGIGNISGWNTSCVTSMSNMFQGSNFNQDIGGWNTSNVVSMSHMFQGSDFNQSIGGWNTSSVTTMEGMFADSNFNQDISGWDTSGVTSVSGMFSVTSFNQDIGGWNVSGVTDMSWMFYGTPFNQNISSWNTSSVTNMGYMFHTSVFNQSIDGWDTSKVQSMEAMFADSVFNQPLNSWDVSNVFHFYSMFANSPFNQPLDNWNTSGAVYMFFMFANSDFNQNISEWNTSGVTTMEGMFAYSPFNQDISGWDVSGVTIMDSMFFEGSLSVVNYDALLNSWALLTLQPGVRLDVNSRYSLGASDSRQHIIDTYTWTIVDNGLYEEPTYCTETISPCGGGCPTTDFSNMFQFYDFDTDSDGVGDITGWNTSCATSMSYMFAYSNFNQDISGWDVSGVTSMSHTFVHTPFNQDISGWDVSKVEDMSYMFAHSPFNQPIGGWDVSSVVNMNSLFFYSSFNQPIGIWNTSSVTNMGQMFGNMNFNQDISGWDVSKVEDMGWMFGGNQHFNQPIGIWNTSSVTSMGAMFRTARGFNQPIGDWDTSNVVSMAIMFSNTDGVNSFNQDIGGWNTSNVTDMNGMFEWTSKFNQDISGWDVSKVTNMADMFDNSVFNQPLNTWNTSSVTNMYSMFGHSSFNTRPSMFNQPLDNWDTSNVTDMSNMFYDNSAFNQPIGSWNTSSVTNMNYMFWTASSFNQDISGWDTSKVTGMEGMFALSPFNQPIGSWNTSSVTSMAGMFSTSSFNQPIGGWDVSSVTHITNMFQNSPFNQDISGWNITSVSDYGGFTEFLNGASMNRTNYDALLLGWSSQPVQPNLEFGATGVRYTEAGLVGRTILTDTYNWTITDGIMYPTFGCVDEEAANFDPAADVDDGSCYYNPGCTDPTAFNYNVSYDFDDGSCYYNPGCTDPEAFNYDETADFDDGSCINYCTEVTLTRTNPLNYLLVNESDVFLIDVDVTCDSCVCENFELHFGNFLEGDFEQLTGGITLIEGVSWQFSSANVIDGNLSTYHYIYHNSGGLAKYELVFPNKAYINESEVYFNWTQYGVGNWVGFGVEAYDYATSSWVQVFYTTDRLAAQLVQINFETIYTDKMRLFFDSYWDDLFIHHWAVRGIESGYSAFQEGTGNFLINTTNPLIINQSVNETKTYTVQITTNTSSGVYTFQEVLMSGETIIGESTSYMVGVGEGIIIGCMNPSADNYAEEAMVDDGTCVIGGCTDSDAFNYNVLATYDDGSCDYNAFLYTVIFGTEARITGWKLDVYDIGIHVPKTIDGYIVTEIANLAFNRHNSLLPKFTGQLTLPPTIRSIGQQAFMKNTLTGSLVLPRSLETMNAYAFDDPYFDEMVFLSKDVGISVSQFFTPLVREMYVKGFRYKSDGVTDSAPYTLAQTSSFLIWEEITEDQVGCTDIAAVNYDAEAVYDDGSCTDGFGCTDPEANNYDDLAIYDDGTCSYIVIGCSRSDALNYNGPVDIDDGSCIYYFEEAFVPGVHRKIYKLNDQPGFGITTSYRQEEGIWIDRVAKVNYAGLNIVEESEPILNGNIVYDFLLSPDETKLFVLNYKGASWILSVYDTETLELTSNTTLNGMTIYMFMNNNGTAIYLPRHGTENIYRYDVETKEITLPLTTGRTGSVYGASPDSKYFFAINTAATSLRIYEFIDGELSSDNLVADLTHASLFRRVSVTNDGSMMYVKHNTNYFTLYNVSNNFSEITTEFLGDDNTMYRTQEFNNDDSVLAMNFDGLLLIDMSDYSKMQFTPSTTSTLMFSEDNMRLYLSSPTGLYVYTNNELLAGCTDPAASNYEDYVLFDTGICEYVEPDPRPLIRLGGTGDVDEGRAETLEDYELYEEARGITVPDNAAKFLILGVIGVVVYLFAVQGVAPGSKSLAKNSLRKRRR